MQIYTDRDGIQRLLEVGRLSIDSDTGKPCLPLLWDTEKDGPLPSGIGLEQLGGLKRVILGGSPEDAHPAVQLEFDQTLKEADDTARAAQEPTYADLRRREYMKIPEHEFREAVYEFTQGRPERMQAYSLQVEEIRKRFKQNQEA